MAADLKRFTTSIPLGMDAELDLVKKERYYRGEHMKAMSDYTPVSD